MATMTDLSPLEAKVVFAIRSSLDIFDARQKASALAKELDFSPAQATLLAAIISELCRDILAHARSGEITLEPLQRGQRLGIRLTALAYEDESGAASDWFLLAQLRIEYLLEEVEFHSRSDSEVALTGIMWRPFPEQG